METERLKAKYDADDILETFLVEWKRLHDRLPVLHREP